MRKLLTVGLAIAMVSTAFGMLPMNVSSGMDDNSMTGMANSVHNANTGENFTTIQAAIDAVNTTNGHTIQVSAGTYNESVVVNKMLTLMGEEKTTTIIDGNNGDTVNFTADGINLSGFTIQSNGNVFGIVVQSNNNTVFDNIISNNNYGMYLGLMSSNTDNNDIFDNIISNNEGGIYIESGICENHRIYHNNFINNTNFQAADNGINNAWDNGYPDGGNYWSDYNGTDNFYGQDQNYSGSDGIGDTPYVFTGAQDDYPFMVMDGWIEAPASSGPIAMWPFNEGFGQDTNDTSGNDNLGALSPSYPSNVPTWTSGINGSALEFDGVDDYVDCGNNECFNFTDNLSIEAWIYPKSINMYNPIVSKRGDGAPFQFWFTEEGVLGFAYAQPDYNWSAVFSDAPIIDTNKWQHIVTTFNSGEIKLYKDGILIKNQSGFDSPLPNSTDPVRIGTSGVAEEFFNGTIDEVSIWDKILTPEEILFNFNQYEIPVTNINREELIIALQNDMNDMNPWNPDTNDEWKSNQIGRNFEGLMAYNPDFELYPVLAADGAGVHGADVAITNGGLKIAVKLKENVTFTDGTPMTSRDVVFSYQTLGWGLFQNHVLGPLYWDNGTFFEDWNGNANQSRIGVQANGTYGVDFFLTEPYAMFWFQTMALPICPAHIWDDGGHLVPLSNGNHSGYEVEAPQMYGWDYGYGSNPSETDATIGTGPWYLESWSPGNGSVIKAYEDYWDKNGTTSYAGQNLSNYPKHVRTITFKIYTQLDDATQALQSGEVHHLPWSLTSGDNNLLKTDPNIGIETPNDQGLFYLNFNQRHGAMADVEFRKAVSYAIDKDYIVNNLMGGYGIKGSVPMSVTNNLYVNTTVPAWIQGDNLAAAQATLDTAGYIDYDGDGWRDMPDGSPLKYDILTPPIDYDPIRANSGIMIEKNLKLIGLNVASVPTSFDTIVSAAFVSVDFDMYILGWSVGSFSENYLRDFFHSNSDTAVNPAGSNSGGYNNPEFDALVDSLEVEIDTDTRAQMIKDACGLVMQDVAYNTLFYRTNIEAYRSDAWTGWIPAFGSIYNGFSINNLTPPSYLNPSYGNLEVGLYVPDILPADDNSTCYVLVTDNDIPVDNASVEVQTNFGATFNGTTNFQGNVEFSYYIPFIEGQAFFSASVSKGNETGGAFKESIILTSKPFAQLSLSTNDGVINPGNSTIVTARVTDNNGNGMSGINVNVDTNLMFGNVDSPGKVTNAAGYANFTYTAPSVGMLPNTHRYEQFKASISVTDTLIPEVQEASLIIGISNDVMDWHIVEITHVDDYIITGDWLAPLPKSTDVYVSVIDEMGIPVIGETVTINIDNPIVIPDAINKITNGAGETVFTLATVNLLGSQSAMVSFNVSKAYSTTDSFLLLNHNASIGQSGYAADINFTGIANHNSQMVVTAIVWDETGAPAVGVPCQFFIPPTAQGIPGYFQGGDEWGWLEYGSNWDMGDWAGYIGSWYRDNTTVTDGSGQLVATIDTPSFAADSIIPLQFGIGGYGVAEGFNFSANQLWMEDPAVWGNPVTYPPMTDGADGEYYWRAANHTISDSVILRRANVAVMTSVEMDRPYVSPENPFVNISMKYQNSNSIINNIAGEQPTIVNTSLAQLDNNNVVPGSQTIWKIDAPIAVVNETVYVAVNGTSSFNVGYANILNLTLWVDEDPGNSTASDWWPISEVWDYTIDMATGEVTMLWSWWTDGPEVHAWLNYSSAQVQLTEGVDYTFTPETGTIILSAPLMGGEYLTANYSYASQIPLNVQIYEGIIDPPLLNESMTDSSGVFDYAFNSGQRSFDEGIGFTSMVSDPEYSQFPFNFYFPYIVMPDNLMMTVEPSTKLATQNENVDFLVTVTDIFGSPVNGSMVWAGNVSSPTNASGEVVLSLMMTGLGIQNKTFNLTFNGKDASMTAGVILEEIISNGSVYNINTGENFTTIQAAIDDSDTMNGHTIEVDAGTYYENVLVNKTLTINGAGWESTIIDGGGIGDVVYINMDWTNITGFTVTNSGNNSNDAGIELYYVQNCHIEDNNISNNNFNGTFLHRSSNNTIANNIANLNNYAGISLFSYSNTNNIYNNIASSNNWDGIRISRSSYNTIESNTVSNNYYGICVDRSNNNDAFINTASNNEYGIMISNSDDNTIYHNNIINNINQALDYDMNSWDNGYPSGGNYWSDYNGTDNFNGPDQNISGPDGIGDTPYTFTASQDDYPFMVMDGWGAPAPSDPVHNINTGENFTTIQAAINAVNTTNGHTIEVDAGTYYENVYVSKQLTINGAGQDVCIIDAGNGVGSDVTGIRIEADWVSITGFTIQNAGYDVGDCGIGTGIIQNCYIANNTVRYNKHGFNIGDTCNSTITNNIAAFNEDQGILLHTLSDYNVITDNTAFNNGDGIHLHSSSYNTISGNNASGNYNAGINFVESSGNNNNNISNNIVFNNNYGIVLRSSYDNIISSNIVSDNYVRGIYIYQSDYQIVTDNILSSNINTGIHISRSNYTTLINNTMTNNGVFIYGELLGQWNTHDMDTSNTVNGKPLYYWKDLIGGTVPLGAGEVILANCTSVTVENQNLNNGSIGLQLGYSDNNGIYNITANSNYWQGIGLDYSHENIITYNTAILNVNNGISLRYSNYNTVENNSATNSNNGILIFSSYMNSILNNTMSFNDHGIYLWDSGNNTITNNVIKSNSKGIYLSWSNGNTVINNNISIVSANVEIGIYVDNSDDNLIANNIIFSEAINEFSYENITGIEIWQYSFTGGDFIEYLANATWQEYINTSGGEDFSYHIIGDFDCPDLDLALFFDWNEDGFAQADEFIELCADADADEEVYVENAMNGTYILKVAGYNVTGGPGHFDRSIIYGAIGIYLSNSGSNDLQGNSISNMGCGIFSKNSESDIIDSTFESNDCGVYLTDSNNSHIYSNNFINNTIQAYDDSGNNSWDNGYPGGGNYWSDYNGTDFFSGSSQDIPGGDGFGDTPYIFDFTQDNYPMTYSSGQLMHSNEYPLIDSYINDQSPTIWVHITDNSAVDISSISFYVNGFKVFNTKNPITGGYNVSYVHEGLFTDGQVVICRIVAEDFDGNSLDWTWSFTVDLTAPEVDSVFPLDGTENFSIHETILVNFTEIMDHVSAESAFSISPAVACDIYWSGVTMIIIPDSALAFNTIYTVTINTTAMDIAGNYLASNYVWSFNTGDTAAPEHSNENPAIDGYTADLTPNIWVHVTDLGGVNVSTIRLYVGGYNIDYDLSTITNGYNVSYWHESGFEAGEEITCRILADDIYGNTLDFTWNFRIDDPPTITNTIPVNGETDIALTDDIVVTFSQAMNTTSVTYSCTPNPGGWSVVWSANNTVATFSHMNPYVENTLYTFTITGGKNANGISLAPGAVPNPWTFTTLGIAPTITSTVPVNGTTGIAPNANIIVTFSEAMDNGSISYICNPDPGGWSVVWSANNTVATFSHTGFSEFLTLHTFEITGGTDIAGNALEAGSVPNPWSWYLSTSFQRHGIADGLSNTLITAWIGGVEYGRTVTSAIGEFWIIIDADGLMPDNVKTGGYPGDTITYAIGDLTGANGVFFVETDIWVTGGSVEGNLNMGASVPLLKISAVTTQSSWGEASDWIRIYNPTGGAVDVSSFAIGIANGAPMPILAGDILPGIYGNPLVAGGELYVNMAKWGGLSNIGNAINLYYNSNIIDRVEYGNIAMEPENTIMYNAPAPGAGMEIFRIAFFDTNNCTADFAVQIEVYPTQMIEIPLTIGWNLISFPLVQSNTSILAVLASIDGQWDTVKYYDTTDPMDPWKSYGLYRTPSMNDLQALDHTMGFWIRMTENSTLQINGELPAITNITLKAGWNLVGYASMTDRLASNALAGTGASIISVYDANQTSLIRDETDLTNVTMRAGEGYWVYVPVDTVWTIDW